MATQSLYNASRGNLPGVTRSNPQEFYADEIQNDLKAALAVIRQVNDLFIFADEDNDCRFLRVDAAKFNEVQAAIRLLRIQP